MQIILRPRILAGNSLSEPFFIGSGEILAVLIPWNWTAAPITWQGSGNDLVYYDLYTPGGAEILTQTVPGKLAAITGSGMPFTRIRSGPAALPVMQVSSVEFEVHVRNRTS